MARAPNGRDLRGFRALEALHHRDFRLLWTGQTVSLIGDGAFLTALGWKTFTIAGSSRLGIVLLCNAIGLLTTLLIGGALGDRLPRKALMIASDFWRFGAVAVLAGADATGHLSFELLIVLATLVIPVLGKLFKKSRPYPFFLNLLSRIAITLRSVVLRINRPNPCFSVITACGS